MIALLREWWIKRRLAALRTRSREFERSAAQERAYLEHEEVRYCRDLSRLRFRRVRASAHRTAQL